MPEVTVLTLSSKISMRAQVPGVKNNRQRRSSDQPASSLAARYSAEVSDSPDKPPPLPIDSLALVIDDPIAPKLLAWWRAVEPSYVDAEEQLTEIAELCGADEGELEITLRRCQVSGLVLDGGGITPVAVQWIYQIIGARLGAKKTPPKKAAAK